MNTLEISKGNLRIPPKAIHKHFVLWLLLLMASFLTAQNKPKKMPLHDRIDLAVKQEFDMTKDPTTNSIPRERMLQAFSVTKALSGSSNGPVAWTERGPDNVGGRTRAILIDRTNSTKIFAGSVGGGLWKLNAAGNAWTNVNDFFNNLAVTTLAQSPAVATDMYMGTGEGFFNGDAIRGLGIWKSGDGGATWSQLSATNNNANFYFVNKIVVTSTGVVLAATGSGYAAGWSGSGGVMRSLDGGATWSQASGVGYTQDIAVAANGTLYAASNGNGVYKSTDNGATWAKIAGGLPASGFGRVVLATAPSVGLTAYAVYDFANNDQRIYKTIDGGTTWTQKNAPANITNYWGESQSFAGGQGWYDLVCTVDPNNANRLFVGGIGIFVSNDGATTWSHVGGHYVSAPNNIHPDQHTITFQPGSSTVIYFGNDGGIYRTTNGSAAIPTTAVINKGYNVTQYYAGALNPTLGSNYMLAGAQDNGTQKYSTAGINSTTTATGGDGAYCHIDQDNASIQITSYQGNGINISNNNGANFYYVNNSDGGHFINPTDYDDVSNVLYGPINTYVPASNSFINGQYFYLNSTLPANPNSAAVTKVTVAQFNNSMPTAVKVSPNTPNRVYFALSGGQLLKLDNANTTTPTVTTLGKPSGGSGWVSSIEIKEGNESEMLMTFSNYGTNSVWRSTDGGVNWVSIEGNLPDMPIRSAIFTPDGAGNILLGTETGVWLTTAINGSSTIWTPINTGLANVRVDMLLSRKSDKLVSAITHGRGVYTTTGFAVVSNTCDVPSGLTATNLTATSATLSWGAVGPAITYTIQYRAVAAASPSKQYETRIPSDPNISTVISGENDVQSVWSNDKSNNGGILVNAWTIVTVPTNSYTLTGLSANTQYEFQVKSNCTAPTASAYSTSASFTTPGVATCAKVPTGLNISIRLYPETQSFYWTGQTDVKGYVIEWRKVGTTTWTTDYTTYTNYGRSLAALGMLPATDYECRVKSVCINDAESAYSDIKTFRTLGNCSAPVTLSLNIARANSVYLYWTSVYTEGYTLAYRKVGDATWLYRSFSNRTNTEIDGLVANTNYECKIKTACSQSAYSNIVYFTTKAATCADIVVTGLQVTNLTNTSATLSWNAVAGATGYNLTVYGLSTPLTAIVTGTSYNLTIPALTYSWQVIDFRVTPTCATNAYPPMQSFTVGNTTTTCANKPPVPMSWKTVVTQTTAKIYWGPSAGATGYIVQYRAAAYNGADNTTPWITAGTTTASVQNFTFSGLTANKTYDYQILACTAGGTYFIYNTFTTSTGEIITPCSAPVPTNLNAYTSTSGGYTQLYWAGSTGAVGYKVQYRVVGSAAAWTTAEVAAHGVQAPLDPEIKNIPVHDFGTEGGGVPNATIINTNNTYYYIDKGILIPNTNYEFQVAANCETGASAFSAMKTFKTPLAACTNITNLRTGGVISNAAWILWDEVYGPGANVLFKKSTDLVWKSLSVMGNYAEFGNLIAGGTYQVKVRVRCGAQSLANASVNTRYEEISFTTPVSTCRSLVNAPGDFYASLVTANSAKLTWKPVLGALKYRVRVYGPTGIVKDDANITTTSLALTALQADGYYSCDVWAICSDGQAYWSTYTNFRTTGTVCYSPNVYQGVAVTTTTADIRIFPVGGVASYQIEYKQPTETVWKVVTILPTPIAPATSPTFKLTGLLDNTYYDFKIKSVCGTTVGNYYYSGNFTTVALPCLKPTLLTKVAVTSSTATVKWTGITGVTKYAVQYRKKPALITDLSWPIPAIEVSPVPTGTTYQYQITGLIDNFDYEIRVKSLCSTVDESDYTVAIPVKTNLYCPTPKEFLTFGTVSSIKISIPPVQGAISYEVYYRKFDATVTDPEVGWGTAIAITTLANPTTEIKNLLPNTLYEVRVRSKCSTTNPSDYTPISLVSTAPCVNVQSYTVTNIKTTTAKVEWAKVEGALGYEIDIKLASATAYTNTLLMKKPLVTATLHPIAQDFTGLTANTLYDVRIRVKCSTTGFSSYLTKQFKTLPINDEPCTAIALTAIAATCTPTIVYSNIGATYSPIAAPLNTQTCPISATTDGDIWFKITIPSTRNATVKFLGVNLPNYYVAVYNNGAALPAPACANITPQYLSFCQNLTQLSFNNYIAGTIFYLRIWSPKTAQGGIKLCMTNVGTIPAATDTQVSTPSGGTITTSTDPIIANFAADTEGVTPTPAEKPKLKEGYMLAYPNPVTQSELKVDYLNSSDNDENVKLELLDVTGKTVIQNTEKAVVGINQFTVKVPNVATGVYLLKLHRDNQEPLVQRIQIMK